LRSSVSKDGRNTWTRGHPSDATLRAAPQDEVGGCFLGHLAFDATRFAPAGKRALKPRLRQNNPTGKFPLNLSGKSVI